MTIEKNQALADAPATDTNVLINMHCFAIFRNKRIDLATDQLEVRIGAAVLYGHGVFTTLAIYDGQPFQWTKHWARLTEHAERSRIDISTLSESRTLTQMCRLIKVNKVVDGRARLTLFGSSNDGDIGGAWSMKTSAKKQKTDLLIITGESRINNNKGLALTCSPFRINTHSPLSGIKSLNYMEHILSMEEARSRKFDEAVIVNQLGEIASVSMANIFWVTKGTLYTPSLNTGCIRGTTRELVIKLAGELAIPCSEGSFEMAALSEAEEIFLTSSGLGVAPVTSFDFRQYSTLAAAAAGSVGVRLRDAFRLSISCDLI
ncbi:MAG: aminotransferase class IV [Pyrinomonadaceae bacterium]